MKTTTSPLVLLLVAVIPLALAQGVPTNGANPPEFTGANPTMSGAPMVTLATTDDSGSAMTMTLDPTEALAATGTNTPAGAAPTMAAGIMGPLLGAAAALLL